MNLTKKTLKLYIMFLFILSLFVFTSCDQQQFLNWLDETWVQKINEWKTIYLDNWEEALSEDDIKYWKIKIEDDETYSDVFLNWNFVSYLDTHRKGLKKYNIKTWESVVFIISSLDNITLSVKNPNWFRFDMLSWKYKEINENKLEFENYSKIKLKSDVTFFNSSRYSKKYISSWTILNFIMISKKYKFSKIIYKVWDYEVSDNIRYFNLNNFNIKDVIDLYFYSNWFNNVYYKKWQIVLKWKKWITEKILSFNVEWNLEEKQKFQTKQNWDDFEISFENLKIWKKYNLTLEVDNWIYVEKYHISFVSIWDMKITKKIDLYKEWEKTFKKWNNRKINRFIVCSNQKLNTKKTLNSLRNSFGSGNIKAYFTRDIQNEYFYWYWQNKYYWRVYLKAEKNTCVTFYYFLNPTKTYNITSKFYSVYWNVLDVNFKIWKFEIPDMFKESKFVWKTFNILPEKWYLWNHIQLKWKNVKKAKINIKTCSLKDINSDIFSKRKKYSKNIMIKDVLDCSWVEKIYTKKIDNFVYRKEFLYEINLSDIFWKNIPKIFYNKWNIFWRTDIGVYYKLTNYYNDENNLYMYFNSLQDWKPLNWEVELKMFYEQEKKSIKKYETKKYQFNNWELKVSVPKNFNFWYAKITVWNDYTIIFISRYKSIWLNRSYFKNDFYTQKYQLWLENSRWWGSEYKIYWYSDRVLYKPWDTIFVAWFVKKINSDWNNVFSWSVEVSLENVNWDIQTFNVKKLDKFWWFKAKFDLPKNSKQWLYSLNFNYIHSDEARWEDYYETFVKVEEFEKHSFFAKMNIVLSKKWYFYRIYPKYYFWWDLKWFDVDANISYKKMARGYSYFKNNWNMCRWYYWDEVLFNNYNEQKTELKKTIKILNNSWLFADINITKFLKNIKYFWEIWITAKIKDNITNEILIINKTIKIAPQILIGIKWWDTMYLTTNEKWKKIEWYVYLKDRNWTEKIFDTNFKILSNWKVKYTLYKYDKNLTEEKWVDWQYYYVNNRTYKKIKEGEINIKNDKFVYDLWKMSEWDFVFRAEYNWYKTEKFIDIYKSDYDYSRRWNILNNIILWVETTKANYKVWEFIDLNIDPYIKWSYVIINIEQWNKILETKKVLLDWNKLQLKVKENRLPNVFISVAEIVPEIVNNKISKNRKEPRFFMWYKEVWINREFAKLMFDVKVMDLSWNEKKYFAPWEKIKLWITTKNIKWEAEETRLSVWIVDKALLDIYDKQRKVIEYFFNRMWDYLNLWFNYKFLYNSLKVFSANWQKWWWGWNTSWIPNVRNKFFDIFFWRWGVFTDKKWYIELTTTVPDNLTTWTIDVLWINKWNKMWIYRKTFNVKKDVMLQTNFPRFLSIWDNIEILTKITKADKSVHISNINGYFVIWKKKINMDVIKSTNDYVKFRLDLNKVDENLILNNDIIKVWVEARNNWKILDAEIVNLPIRSDNFILKNNYSYDWSNTWWIIKLGKWTKYVNTTITVSKTPIKEFENIFYQLLNYPYGCTEQILSSLYPITEVMEIWQKFVFSNKIILYKSWKISKIYIKNRWYRDLKVIFWESLSEIQKHQKDDWWMWYWRFKSEISSVDLSIYTYFVVKKIKKLWFNVDNGFLIRLKNYLNKKNMSLKQKFYYYLNLSYLWEKVDINYILENLDHEPYTKILWFIILVNEKYQDKELLKKYKLISDNLFKSNKFIYSFFYGYTNIKIMYNKALLKLWYLSEVKTFIKNYIYDKNFYSVRYNTNNNVLFSDLLKDYILIIEQSWSDVNFNITVNWKKYTWKIWWTNIMSEFSFSWKNINELKYKINSDWELHYNLFSKFLSFDYKWDKKYWIDYIKIKWENNIDLKEKIKWTKIWWTIKTIWSFKTNKDAYKLAVSFSIPSNTKILNPNLVKNTNDYWYSDMYSFYEQKRWYNYWYWAKTVKKWNKLSFINFIKNENYTGYYSCVPDYFDIKYDKLFLYYDQFPKWWSCKIEFNLIKTHNSEFINPFSQIFEMYWWIYWIWR